MLLILTSRKPLIEQSTSLDIHALSKSSFDAILSDLQELMYTERCHVFTANNSMINCSTYLDSGSLKKYSIPYPMHSE